LPRPVCFRAQGAADLEHRILEHTLHKALAANVGQVKLCVTPPAVDPVWQALRLSELVQWSDQGASNLGQRMARAAQQQFQPIEFQAILALAGNFKQL
jgi:hypothetical protein